MVCIGNPVDGFHFYGPFEDSERADKFGSDPANNEGKEWWIIPIWAVKPDGTLEEP
jgi:hypothetical protein